MYKFKDLREDGTIQTIALDPDAPRHASARTPEAKKLLDSIKRQLLPEPIVMDVDRRGKPLQQVPDLDAQLRTASKQAIAAERSEMLRKKLHATQAAKAYNQTKARQRQAEMEGELAAAASQIQELREEIATLKKQLAASSRTSTSWSYSWLIGESDDFIHHLSGLARSELARFVSTMFQAFKFAEYWRGKRKRRMAPADALMLCLLRLRRNVTIKMLSKLFDVPHATGQRAFLRTLYFLSRVGAVVQNAHSKDEVAPRRYFYFSPSLLLFSVSLFPFSLPPSLSREHLQAFASAHVLMFTTALVAFKVISTTSRESSTAQRSRLRCRAPIEPKSKCSQRTNTARPSNSWYPSPPPFSPAAFLTTLPNACRSTLHRTVRYAL